MECKISIKLGNYQGKFIEEKQLERSSRKKWAEVLVQTLTRGVLKLWMERNNILHARARNGLKLQKVTGLWDKIQIQLNLGVQGLDRLERSEWTWAVNNIQDWPG